MSVNIRRHLVTESSRGNNTAKATGECQSAKSSELARQCVTEAMLLSP